MAQAVSEFQSLLAGLAGELQARIDRLLPVLVERLDRAELFAFITDAFPELLEPFLAAAADLTAVWYEDQNPDSGFRASPAELTAREALEAVARWAVSQDDPAAALGGAATKELFDVSRRTVIENAAVEGVRWARHASANACGFCRLLAIKGAVYRTEDATTAMKHTDAQGHNHCHCIAVPVHGTYEPPAYVKQWKLDYEAARAAGAKTPGQIANAMDYMPGGRRYKGDDAPPHQPRYRTPVKPAPKPTSRPRPSGGGESDAKVAARLLPGLEKSLADLRAKGLPEDSPQIKYHLETIARLRRQLQPS